MTDVHALPQSSSSPSIVAVDPPTDSTAAETVENDSPNPNQDRDQPRQSHEIIQVDDPPTDPAAAAAQQVVSNVRPRPKHPSRSRYSSPPSLGNCYGLVNKIDRDTPFIGYLFDLFDWTFLSQSPQQTKLSPNAFPKLKRELCSKQLPDEPAAEKSSKLDARLVLSHEARRRMSANHQALQQEVKNFMEERKKVELPREWPMNWMVRVFPCLVEKEPREEEIRVLTDEKESVSDAPRDQKNEDETKNRVVEEQNPAGKNQAFFDLDLD